MDELAVRKFVMIENSKSEHLENEALFGDCVWASFPSAREDIKSAGNCLALNLNTAAVFHLMRTAELGMRALAENLKVRLKQKGKSKPIKHAGWDDIITY